MNRRQAHFFRLALVKKAGIWASRPTEPDGHPPPKGCIGKATSSLLQQSHERHVFVMVTVSVLVNQGFVIFKESGDIR